MSVEDLKQRWQELEAEAVEMQNQKDAEIDAVREKYGDRLREAVDKAAAAQKEYLDEEVRESLRDRPDGEAVAKSLGIDLS